MRTGVHRSGGAKRWAGLAALVAASAAATWAACSWQARRSAADTSRLRYLIPATISPEAQAVYARLLPALVARNAVQRQPRTAEEFAQRDAERQAGAAAESAAALERWQVTATPREIAGVHAIEFRPADDRDDGSLLLYVHGGGFVTGSAQSSAGLAATIAGSSGRRLLSIDYTRAPEADFRRVTDQVVAVYRALLAQGRAAGTVGMVGESAGGTIVAASALKLRDENLPMPGALVLLSPLVDLAMKGDTDASLARSDPALYDDESLRAAAALYAPPADWGDPYASPIHGDFARGYPPVLLQAGTKERLLSDAVRLYQAVKTAGGVAELDVYEGMPHAFQGFMRDTPEQAAALAAARRFWDAHLGAGG